MTGKWKTTIVIWSDADPQNTELSDLAQDATDGGSICTKQESSFVDDPGSDDDWYGNEFFNGHEDFDEDNQDEIDRDVAAHEKAIESNPSHVATGITSES